MVVEMTHDEQQFERIVLDNLEKAFRKRNMSIMDEAYVEIEELFFRATLQLAIADRKYYDTKWEIKQKLYF